LISQCLQASLPRGIYAIALKKKVELPLGGGLNAEVFQGLKGVANGSLIPSMTSIKSMAFIGCPIFASCITIATTR